jgi:hypothetical protein
MGMEGCRKETETTATIPMRKKRFKWKEPHASSRASPIDQRNHRKSKRKMG